MITEVDDKRLMVVDTPGLFDSQQKNEATKEEIKKCIEICAPSIHAILYVVSLYFRLTYEDIQTFQNFVTFFGEDMYKHTIVIFTNPDQLAEQGQTLEDYITQSPDLCAFVKKCSNRKLAIDNKASKFIVEQQRRTILTNIKLMIHENGGKGYTNEKFTEAGEKMLRKMREKYKKEYVDKLEKAKEEYRKKIRKELENKYTIETKRLEVENDRLHEQINSLRLKFQGLTVDETREHVSTKTANGFW